MVDLRFINPFMTEADIIKTGFYMISASVMKGLKLQPCST